MEFTELMTALSGKRYDAFMEKEPPPPFPPLLICTPGDPFQHNIRFLEDVEILARLAASSEDESLPPFTPLALGRGADIPCTSDLPSWERPEVFCDPSGQPQEAMLLPIGAVWRHLFGESGATMPLWIGYVPGNLFAVTREAALRPHGLVGRGAASACYASAMSACGLNQRYDPVAGLAMERLWRHIFVGESG